jgi:hypothetical protein
VIEFKSLVVSTFAGCLSPGGMSQFIYVLAGADQCPLWKRRFPQGVSLQRDFLAILGLSLFPNQQENRREDGKPS